MTYSSVLLCLASFALAAKQDHKQPVHPHVQASNAAKDKFEAREKRAEKYKKSLGVVLEEIQRYTGDGHKAYTSKDVVMKFTARGKPDVDLRVRYCESSGGFGDCDGLNSDSLDSWKDYDHKRIVEKYGKKNVMSMYAEHGFRHGYFYCTKVGSDDEGSQPPSLVAISVAETKPEKLEEEPLGERFSLASTGTAKEYEGYGIATTLNVLRVEWLKKRMTDLGLLATEPITCTNAGWRTRAETDPQNTGSLTTYGFPLLMEGFTCVHYIDDRDDDEDWGYTHVQEMLTHPENHKFGRGDLSFYHETSSDEECKKLTNEKKP